MRAFSMTDTIKTATQQALCAVGGVSSAAGLLSVGSSTLSKYASHDDEWADRVIRLDLAVSLDRAAGHPFLLQAYQQLFAGEQAEPSGLCARAALRLNRILDDVVREVAAAIDDERVDPAEKLAIRKRIAAAQQELARLEAAVR